MDSCKDKLKKARELIKEANEELIYEPHKHMLYKAGDKITEALKSLGFEDKKSGQI